MSSIRPAGPERSGGGVSARLPARWYLVTTPLTKVVSPVQRLVVASYRLRQDRPDPGCTPDTAIRRLPANGAFLLMWEHTSESRLSRRDLLRFDRRPAQIPTGLRATERGHGSRRLGWLPTGRPRVSGAAVCGSARHDADTVDAAFGARQPDRDTAPRDPLAGNDRSREV